MATFNLSCVSSSGGSNASTYFKQNSTVQVTYTASNGTLTITEIKGARSDGYPTYDTGAKSVTISIGGQSKTVALSNYVGFDSYNSYITWGATDTSWSGLSGTSISVTITLPSSTIAFDSTKFTGTATMSWSTYSVTYDANGGSGAPDPQTKTYGTDLTLSSVKPTRKGYTFMGWATSASGDVSYSPGDKYKKNSGLKLYAKWSENSMTVYYYGNGADYGTYMGSPVDLSDVVHTDVFLYDNSYTTGLSNVQNKEYLYLSRTGYTSTGYWLTAGTNFIAVHEDDTSLNSGEAVAKAFGMTLEKSSQGVRVYAQWQINNYTINYNPSGGHGSMNSNTVQWGQTFTYSKNTFVREGYKFVGWNLYRNNDNKWYVKSHGWLTEDEILANGHSKKVYKDEEIMALDSSWINGNDAAREFTLYAIWEISGVVYIDNGVSFEPYLAYIHNGT